METPTISGSQQSQITKVRWQGDGFYFVGCKGSGAGGLPGQKNAHTVLGVHYVDRLRQLWEKIKIWCGKLTRGVIFHLVFQHLLYSLYLAILDYYQTSR